MISTFKGIRVGSITIGGGNPFVLIAGPDVIESEEFALSAAHRLQEICLEEKVPFIFKCSYDKANRTSLRSFRGPGLERGLEILQKVKETVGVKVLSDVHCCEEVQKASEVLDVVQIPAFLSRQTDLLLEVARHARAINIKKGQFLSPWDVQSLLEKIHSVRPEGVMVTERGTTFGYNNLVVDFRSLVVLRGLGCPVVFDGSHTVQLPGGLGSASGGQREFIPPLCRAAVGTGIDALFLEVHPDPDRALCDGPSSYRLEELPPLIQTLKRIDSIVKGT